jgi:hypothetical protein
LAIKSIRNLLNKDLLSMPSWLRLPRRPASVKALASEPQGLDAFTSEDVPAVASAPEDQASKNLRLVAGFLVLLVALQAYPSALWLRSGWRRSVDPPAATARPEAPASTATAAAVPAGTTGCEPAPPSPASPVAPAATSASSAAASVTPPVAPATPAASPQGLAGMLKVTAPVPLKLFLKGRLVGTTEADSTMLPQGTHELEFLNDSVGFRARRTVSIKAGTTSTVKLDAPPGTLHINAVPWAEVWIDGERIGETPIGNLPARIGNREIVFRHPDLGERRTTALVTLKEPVRISMDLRKK